MTGVQTCALPILQLSVIIIGLGLVQMTVLARIIDNHQFGLLTVSLVIIALADTLSDFGIANSIIQRKEISHLELTTLYWLNVGLGIVVCVAVFLLSDLIGDLLNNPDLAPLIKTLSLAFVVIPHGQQFRALMQKELEFNKIGMIETSAVLAIDRKSTRLNSSHSSPSRMPSSA